VAEVSSALLSPVYDNHHSDNFYVAAHHPGVGQLVLECLATTAVGIHVHFMRTELDPHVLFCGATSPVEIAALPLDVYDQPIHELDLHGVWDMHGRAENMGWAESRCWRC